MPKSRQLTAHQVHAIRQHRQDGDTIAAIAVAYSRDIRTIADLLAGRTYQHVPENILSRELPGQAAAGPGPAAGAGPSHPQARRSPTYDP